jgi:hypothetical protein
MAEKALAELIRLVHMAHELEQEQDQELRAPILLEEATWIEVGILSLLQDLAAQTAALSMHFEEAGEEEEEKEEEKEEKVEEDMWKMWWSEEEYVEEENEFEPEPKEPEEQSKFAVEKEQRVRENDPGGRKIVCGRGSDVM